MNSSHSSHLWSSATFDKKGRPEIGKAARPDQEPNSANWRISAWISWEMRPNRASFLGEAHAGRLATSWRDRISLTVPRWSWYALARLLTVLPAR